MKMVNRYGEVEITNTTEAIFALSGYRTESIENAAKLLNVKKSQIESFDFVETSEIIKTVIDGSITKVKVGEESIFEFTKKSLRRNALSVNDIGFVLLGLMIQNDRKDIVLNRFSASKLDTLSMKNKTFLINIHKENKK
jgi:hypothetical protein